MDLNIASKYYHSNNDSNVKMVSTNEIAINPKNYSLFLDSLKKGSEMLVLMLIFGLCLTDLLAQSASLRKLAYKLPILSKADHLVAKFVKSIRQQQMNIDAEKATEMEEKRRKIFNEYLVSRIRGSVLKDYYSRF